MIHWRPCLFSIALCVGPITHGKIFYDQNKASDYDKKEKKTLTKYNEKKERELPLTDAIFLALRFNQEVKNAEIDRAIARYNLRAAQNEFELQYTLGAGAGFNQTVADGAKTQGGTQSVNSSVSYKLPIGTSFTLSPGISSNIGGTWAPSVGLSFKQPLLRGFGTSVVTAGIKNAYDSEKKSRLETRAKVIAQVVKVVKAYRALILENYRIETSKRSVDEQKRVIRINQEKINVGRRPRTSNLQAQSQLEKLQLDLTSQKNDRDNKRQDFLTLIGINPNLQMRFPKDEKLITTKVPNLQKTIDKALAGNIDYQKAKIDIKRTERSLVRAKNNMAWEVNVSGEINYTANSDGFNGLGSGRHHNEKISIGVTVPINNFELEKSLVEADVALKRAKAALDQIRKDVVRRAKNAIVSLTSLAQQVKMARESMSKAKQTYLNELTKQNLGRASDQDVKVAQDAYITSQESYISRKINYNNEFLELSAFLGTTLDEYGIKVKY